MKRILITGKNSYVGMSVKDYLLKWSEEYSVEEISVRGEEWKVLDFSKYDVIFHVAGIAHVDTKKADEKTKKLYYAVNTDLAVEVAEKAKKDGVKQFIYMSSAIVYGDSSPIGKTKIITKNTKPQPKNFYGDSKLQAEKRLGELEDAKFKVALLRPPMIYGAGCKGNYQTLRKIALKLPIFPKVKNERSMIYIENFAEFVKRAVDGKYSGVYCPSNKETVATYEIVGEIAKCHGRKILIVPGFGWPLKIMSHFTPIVNKAFGSMVYSKELSSDFGYCIYSVGESVREIEEKAIQNNEERNT
ncbi:NAD-dependent epimerase/dehydratase family protein [Candidatus Saccharibacteria bacterium]|nr:NAD-dependent epimerase/dehydratase family protein [Candidatus Saccharibacteria bacterium]